ncbi:hypothetical protein ACQV5M_18705, partial [Leptospira sp. SA-E8]|uniref:hypothetical protein n=1 Tax=Leptospira sp. SA-E8 TaxID=3422259 RepID=UPI003EB867FD
FIEKTHWNSKMMLFCMNSNTRNFSIWINFCLHVRLTTEVLRRSQRREFAHANEVTEANVAKPKRAGHEVNPERRGGTESYPTFSSRIGKTPYFTGGKIWRPFMPKLFGL